MNNIFLKKIYFLPFILLLTLVLAACNNSKNVSTGNIANPVDSEADKIKEINQDAVKQAQQNTIKTVRTIDAGDHYKGDLKAPVQIIVYNDYECPFCAAFKDTIDEVAKNYGDKVVIAFRHYLLRSHAMALPAALASECAAEQEKFWEMSDMLFQNNKDDKLTMDQLDADAKELKLDIIKFKQCLDTQKYKDKIQTQLLEAVNFGVGGTPGVFVNGEPLPGAYPYEDFAGQDGKNNEGMKSIIERHLNTAK